jgi:RNA polymerase sigma-70 factor (ECF subfamily)
LLERLRRQSAAADWNRLDQLYRPLLHHWLLRDPTLGAEAEDLVQEIMTVLVRELPQFERARLGSFRSWLKTIALNRLKAFWRSRKSRPALLGNGSSGSPLAQLEDAASELSRQWDQEHDQFIIHRLLEMIEPEFAASTWQAFRGVVWDERKPEAMAAELGLSVNAVLLAKSRVLKRLREEGRGLLD